MAMLIGEGCIACFACHEDCPNGAITPGDIFVIDWERCTECAGTHESPQCASVCPVDCIGPDPLHHDTRDELLAKKQRNEVLRRERGR